MKKLTFAVIAALALSSAPAFANDFTGVRAEVTTGAENVINGIRGSDITYGAAVGVDIPLSEKVTAGVEANVENVFDRRQIGASARIGYVVAPRVLVYAKAGYSNYELVTSKKLDGFRVGGGVEFKVVGPLFTGIEYNYADFQGKTGQNAVKVRAGLRF